MRLIHAATLKIHEIVEEAKTPSYAILSHTWGNEECSLQDMKNFKVGIIQKREGFRKIDLCCKQALKDGYEWAWVDTCCIDKTSTADLSEAINSMFRWYRAAAICYAYLVDAEDMQDFEQSRWWTRGWTLQELVAPATVHFFNSNWKPLGSKLELCEQIQRVTGIGTEVLTTGDFSNVSIAQRMSWASHRHTTRVEDLAYCLMGLFDVNMPLLYGEGKKSFQRLQEEIMKGSGDQSLFAWGLPEKVRTMYEFYQDYQSQAPENLQGLFASSPYDFRFAKDIFVLEHNPPSITPTVYNNGVRIEFKIIRPRWDATVQFAIIFCTVQPKFCDYIAIPIVPWGKNCVARCGELVMVATADLPTPIEDNHCIRLIKPPTISESTPLNNIVQMIEIPSKYQDCYTLKEIHCASQVQYSMEDRSFTLPRESKSNTVHAVLIYSFTQTKPMSLLPRDLEQESFRKQTKERKSLKHIVGGRKVSSYHMHQTPFAVIFGGVLGKLWVDCMPISGPGLMSNDSDDNPFITTTRNSLISRLGTNSPMPYRYEHKSLVVLAWGPKESSMNSYNTEWAVRVHADLRVVSKSLLEKSLLLSIVLAGDETDGEARYQVPDWWDLAKAAPSEDSAREPDIRVYYH